MERIESSILVEFIGGYIEALLWSSTDDVNGETLEGLEDYNLAPVARVASVSACCAFVAYNYPDLVAAVETPGYSWGHAGHDFWMTRAGHGVGYWDGDLPDDIGNRLTAATERANAADGCSLVAPDPYVGDDGLVYLAGLERGMPTLLGLELDRGEG